MKMNGMKMVDMKLPKAALKAGEAALTSPAQDPYPYGLCLNLDTRELDKLGIKELPEVGEEYYICAIGKVTRVNASASEQEKNSRSIAVQIISLSLQEEMEHEGEGKETMKSESSERKGRGARSAISNTYQS